MDTYSDLDLDIIFTEIPTGEMWRETILSSLTPRILTLIKSSTWIMCLFAAPLLRVDIHFLRVSDLYCRYRDPDVVFDRFGSITNVLETTSTCTAANLYAQPTLTQLKAQFALKLFDCIEALRLGNTLHAVVQLGQMQADVLAPLVSISKKTRCRGVRHFEERYPHDVSIMKEIVPRYSAAACWRSLRTAVTLYTEKVLLLDPPNARRSILEQTSMEWFLRFYNVSD